MNTSITITMPSATFALLLNAIASVYGMPQDGSTDQGTFAQQQIFIWGQAAIQTYVKQQQAQAAIAAANAAADSQLAAVDYTTTYAVATA